jgi:hypothetical protein
MPMHLDYLNWSGQGPIPTRRPPHGLHEVHVAEMAARLELMGEAAGFAPQFRLARASWSESDLSALRRAYLWLASKATGPWHWEEAVEDGGTNLRHVSVYVERFTDQERFARAFDGAFATLSAGERELERLAVARGVIPRPSEETTFALWAEANRGYGIEIGGDGRDGSFRVWFTHPEMEEAFAEAFADVAFGMSDGGGCDAYGRDGSSPGDAGLRIRACGWLRDNAAIRDVSEEGPPDGLPFRYAVRYEGTADLVRWQWSDILESEPEGSVFAASKRPDRRDLTVPDDFMAYVRGTAETYSAPHLPAELRSYTLAVEIPPDRTLRVEPRMDPGATFNLPAKETAPEAVSWKPLSKLYVSPNGLVVEGAASGADIERLDRKLGDVFGDPDAPAVQGERVQRGEAQVFGVYRNGRPVAAGELVVREEDIRVEWCRGMGGERADPVAMAAVKSFLAAVALGDLDLNYEVGEDAFIPVEGGACAYA